LAYSSEQTISVSTIAELGNFDPGDFEMLPPDGVLLIASWLDAFDRTRPKSCEYYMELLDDEITRGEYLSHKKEYCFLVIQN
jgi:hypothetical protein